MAPMVSGAYMCGTDRSLIAQLFLADCGELLDADQSTLQLSLTAR